MGNCFGEDAVRAGVHDAETLRKLVKMDLDMKIRYSQVIIKKFYIENEGRVAVAFSGGKDSTVLLHLVRSIPTYDHIPGVFYDTGLEFPEIREHVRSFENITWCRPAKSFKQVVMEKGYPVIGKDCAHYINLAQRGQPSGIKMMESDSRYGCKRYAYMIDAPFKISQRCCDVMKKNTAKKYHRDTGNCQYIGSRVDESDRREQAWLEYGDNRNSGANAENGKIPLSNPLSIWTQKDINDYIARFNIKLAKVYYMGYERTGCIFCMFGIMHDRGRFLKLKATHPKQWAYCMKPIEEGGLGLKDVLEYMGIPTGIEQSNLFEFEEGGMT